MKRYLFVALAVVFMSALFLACVPKEKNYNETTKELVQLVESNPELKSLLVKPG